MPGLLTVFAAQLPALAQNVLPGAAFLTCEARRGGSIYASLVDEGLPLGPKYYLKFGPWQPTPMYAKTFPATCADMAYLRAALPVALPKGPK